MSNFVIFDTSIFIDHLRTGRHQQRIESVTGLIRTSSKSLLPSTIGTIQFNQGAPAYTISPFFAFAINGGGIVNNSSNAPTLNVGFSLQFFNASTASNATIVTQSSVEQLTSLFEIAFSGANTQRFELDERFADIQRGLTGFVSNLPTAPAPAETGTGKSVVEKEPVFEPMPQNRWGVWANGWGDWVSVGNDGVAKGYNFTTGGFILGDDFHFGSFTAM